MPEMNELPTVVNKSATIYKKTLWIVIASMLTPLEYLLFTINMLFLADSYLKYSYIQRAANLL